MARALILVSSEIDNEIDVERIIEQNLELQVSDIVQQIEVECKNAGIETDDENLWWLTIDISMISCIAIQVHLLM